MGEAIQGILFDLDETLYSREQAFWAWIEDESFRCGARSKVDLQTVSQLDQRGRGEKARMLSYIDEALGWGLAPAQQLSRFRQGLSTHLHVDPGVVPLIKTLRARYHVGLVTNGTSESQRLKLRTLGLEDLFEPVLISGEVGFKKPDSRIFELAMSGWQTPPEAILFVGDDPDSDIQGARNVGMQSLQVGSSGDIESVLLLPQWLSRQSLEQPESEVQQRAAGSPPKDQGG